MKKLTAADFEKPVMYRGIKIPPLPKEIYGERSARALAIRDALIEDYNKRLELDERNGRER